MSDDKSPFAMLPRELPGEEAAREERHQLLATLLGAFADGELPAETVSQIDAHLLGCARCRRELTVHRALRLRLEQEPLSAAPAALRDRIAASLAAAPAPEWESVAASGAAGAAAADAKDALRSSVWSRLGMALTVLAVAGVLFVAVRWAGSARAGVPVTMVQASSQSLFSAVLGDSRRVMAGDLPGRARDLGAVRAAMPFPVQALESPELRLLAAWTTTVEGEPAAVLAYRWNDQVVLQYLVSDQQLYRPSELRTALAGGRALGAQDGPLALVAWPGASWGSMVVSTMPIDRLRTLRGADAQR